ncbi:HAD family hydrolase [Streptomyces sp. NBC_01497]|uniref:HAD family hydrolase n=1 Tax=Streptomyces sp. NBC_01497 TaxID=2903885 RepID=UPI002E367D52|nr:HAD family hydrolase [Streptomyces sp. NBC_01497]
MSTGEVRGEAESAGGGAVFPYRLVATDLDGTLLREDGSVSGRSRAALAAVTAAGAAHIVVTGRSVPWARDVLADLGYEGIAVCGQGSQVYHAGEHRLLTSLTLDRQVARLAIEKIEAELGRPALAVSQDGVEGLVLTDERYVIGGRKADRDRARMVRDAADLWAAPINKVYLQHPTLDDDQLALAARDIVGGLTDVLMAGPGAVELIPVGLTKARGLSLAARRLGVTAQETIAFGDMPNDLPMFTWAAWGVAMANAHPDLLAVADEVTATNAEDGVAIVLEKLLADGPATGA